MEQNPKIALCPISVTGQVASVISCNYLCTKTAESTTLVATCYLFMDVRVKKVSHF